MQLSNKYCTCWDIYYINLYILAYAIFPIGAYCFPFLRVVLDNLYLVLCNKAIDVVYVGIYTMGSKRYIF
jgi:hypothetical protein